MERSRIAVFTEVGEPLALKETTVPELKDGELLVRNEYTTLCRSDLNTYSGKRNEKSPTILGHEITGRIEEVGQAAGFFDVRGERLMIGDRITWAIYSSDPTSENSRRGIPQKGAELFKYGHEELTPQSTLHGGLAEYTITRKNTPVAKLAESVPLPVAAIINCAVATVAGGLRLAGNLHKKNILISGSGMLGIIACAMARTAGAERIVAIDISESRLATAQRFGADAGIVTPVKKEALRPALLQEEANDVPYDIALDFSGVPDAMESTLELLRIGGIAVWVGATYPQRDLRLNAEVIVRNLYTIRGLHNYNETDFIAAVEFIENHHLDFPFIDLIEDRFTLDSVNEAFEYALKHNPYRVGIRISG